MKFTQGICGVEGIHVIQLSAQGPYVICAACLSYGRSYPQLVQTTISRWTSLIAVWQQDDSMITSLLCTEIHSYVLHCTTLHFTSLHCTTRHCTSLYLPCTALYCTALHCTALLCSLMIYTACTGLHCTMLLCTALQLMWLLLLLSGWSSVMEPHYCLTKLGGVFIWPRSRKFWVHRKLWNI